MSQPAPKPATGKTRRGWVVNQILKGIFTGEFKGGDRLVEEELASIIGVSRTPVREAFCELAGIGVIELKPNAGAMVRPFGPEQIREMYHIRQLLEAEAARLAASRIDESALRDIRERTVACANEPPSPQWTAQSLILDQEFHEIVSVGSGSTRLAEEIARYRNLVDTIREAVGNTSHALEVALVEHTQVIDALLARDAEAAAAAMTQHIRRGTEAAIGALFPAVRATTYPAPARYTQDQTNPGSLKV